MKLSKAKYLFTLIIISILLFPLQSSAFQKTYFDVKTKFSEKTDLTVAKNSAIIILRQSDWAGVKEYGEDYSLWLRNYEKRKSGDRITVSLDVEIRTPALVRSGKLLKSSRVNVSYNLDEEWKGIDSISKAVKQALKSETEDIKKEALFVGEAVVNKVYDMLKELE